MKKLLTKTALVLSGIISFLGIQPPPAKAIVTHNQHIAEVQTTTPLYLQLGVDSKQLNNDKSGDRIAQHFSHSSHESHASHYSHRSGY
jgi:hypothetical protein